jgi:hypothetical protein
MKSPGVIGVVYNLRRKEELLSLEMIEAENRETKARPKTVIPGVK